MHGNTHDNWQGYGPVGNSLMQAILNLRGVNLIFIIYLNSHSGLIN